MRQLAEELQSDEESARLDTGTPKTLGIAAKLYNKAFKERERTKGTKNPADLQTE